MEGLLSRWGVGFPFLMLALAGCAENQASVVQGVEGAEATEVQATPIDNMAGRNLERRAHNHFVCMGAFGAAIDPCVDMAANQRTAESLNQQTVEIYDERSVPIPAGSITAEDFAKACIGRNTGNVFGDALALDYAMHNSGPFTPGNRAEARYDWTADGLDESVRSVIDRIYAQPEAEAPDWLKRPIGRFAGHIHHGSALLQRAGFEPDEIEKVMGEYMVDLGYDLTGQHPENQEVSYKVKACVDLL